MEKPPGVSMETSMHLADMTLLMFSCLGLNVTQHDWDVLFAGAKVNVG